MTTGFISVGGRDVIVKDPDAKLAYGRNWADWLAVTGATIASATWSISPSGEMTINEAKSGVVGSIAYVYLEGGVAGRSYTATCHVVLSNGDEDDRSFDVRCEDR